MYDPTFIDKVHAVDVEVINIMKTTSNLNVLKCVVTLQGKKHALILKRNVYAERDQVVIDRLKHVFNLVPMHTFCMLMNFEYRNGVRFTCDWVEYLAFASSLEEVQSSKPLPHFEFNLYEKKIVKSTDLNTKPDVKLEGDLNIKPDVKLEGDLNTKLVTEPHDGTNVELNDESNNHITYEQRVDIAMIIMFRYLVGVPCSDEHIILRSERYISISEMKMNSVVPNTKFIRRFAWIAREVWEEARSTFCEHVNMDDVRGIILQTGSPVRNMFMLRARGKLSKNSRVVIEGLEMRLETIQNLPMGALLRLLGVE
jgi:hypothetical protein